MIKALRNIRILDFTKLLPGPLGTQLLSAMGADIIKIEKSDSRDHVRFQPPFIDGVSTLYAALNNNKTELILDFNTDEGNAKLREEVEKADVLIEQFRPGVMKHWGLDYETLKSINPKLIYISLSGYGQNGPNAKEAGHDLNYMAVSGVLDLIRDEKGKPVIPGIQIADIAAGAYILQSACLAAVLERHNTGKGMYLDISMTDGLLPLMVFPLSQFWGGFDPRKLQILSGGLVNYNVYESADGRWVALGALEMKFWNAFCIAVNKPEWKREELLELSVHVFPKEELEMLFKTRNRDEWADWAKGKDMCLTAVIELQELEESAQIKSGNFINTINKFADKALKYIEYPIRISQ